MIFIVLSILLYLIVYVYIRVFEMKFIKYLPVISSILFLVPTIIAYNHWLMYFVYISLLMMFMSLVYHTSLSRVPLKKTWRDRALSYSITLRRLLLYDWIMAIIYLCTIAHLLLKYWDSFFSIGILLIFWLSFIIFWW